MTRKLRIATRGSALALAQTGMIGAELTRLTGVDVTITVITTEGDTSRASLASIGGTGVFASALRAALVEGSCDLVVHSLKDLPTANYPGLVLGAIPRREDPRDALCARDGLTLAELPPGARIGTGSPRRVAQLLSLRPDVTVVDIRGNVDTRLAKVSSGELDAVVLAAAGLTRLQRLDAVSEFFDLAIWPTAPGQGALAIEAREEDSIPELMTIHDANTGLSIAAERAVLAALEAGCSAPVGASAVLEGSSLNLSAVVYAADGSSELESNRSAVLPSGVSAGVSSSGLSRSAGEAAAAELGSAVARQLLDGGAGELAALGAAS
ncbi:hydroxymethylbilane synthase [Subtercola boreus]|uniref:Porphobilinogen deaminase n=1 Tax=Subtercola boreus TaxID=120213 RepID=A0A3E0WE41_9MICO|nr:hydroxymethylbilane synthase [Subtercola boreus]RFA23480.1 hydroxymethylbilane synthase [Subtercola boreus]RFA23873.1 hydroxymethylbilane synthase [Subtercola boreus]RFA29574.1 hydroxymethylbilane synthase [Subtercola boreus]